MEKISILPEIQEQEKKSYTIRKSKKKELSQTNIYLKKFELKKTDSDFPNIKISGPDDAAAFIRQFYSEDIAVYESFFILLLNSPHKTIGYAKISQGGTAGSIVDVKLIAKYCVEGLAQGVILAHNHPSGSLDVSVADRSITVKVQRALEYLDVEVCDHIIITENDYFSMKCNGMI